MDELEKILGYKCNAILKKKILAEAARDGVTIEQSALKYRMPEIVIMGRDPLPEKLYPGDVLIKCENQFKNE